MKHDRKIHQEDGLREQFSQVTDIDQIPTSGWCWIGLYSVADPTDPEILPIIKAHNENWEYVPDDSLPNHHTWRLAR